MLEKGYEMRVNVHWPGVKAETSQGEMEVTLYSWDVETQEGKALLPDGGFTLAKSVDGKLAVSLEGDDDYDPFASLR
jgi:hypothetical protein